MYHRDRSKINYYFNVSLYKTLPAFLIKKWSISIITTIGNFGNLLFNDIENRVEGITAKILTERLKELEEKSIVQRREINEIPRRVEYSLTKQGQELRNALAPLIHWAEHRKTELS